MIECIRERRYMFSKDTTIAIFISLDSAPQT